MSVVTTNPDANAVANRTDETVAPTPAPAAAPHTMNTYKNDAINSANIDLELSCGQKKNGRERKKERHTLLYHIQIVFYGKIMSSRNSRSQTRKRFVSFF